MRRIPGRVYPLEGSGIGNPEDDISTDQTLRSCKVHQPDQAIDVKSTGLAEGSDQLKYASGSSEGHSTARIAHRP